MRQRLLGKAIARGSLERVESCEKGVACEKSGSQPEQSSLERVGGCEKGVAYKNA